jgi:RecA/RadA recombinase
MLDERDIDGKRFGNVPVKTVQQFKNNCLQCINQYLAMPADSRPKLLLALDSLGMLSTTKEMEDSNDGKDTKDMTRAQIIKAAFRVLTLKLSLANVPMIITNHTYAEMGLYPTQVMSGGGGIKYAASTIVFLSKRKEKDGTEVIGNVIHAKLNKSRIARENMQVDTMLHYTKGLNKYYGLDELALECGVFKKSGTRIELPDGTKLFSKAILANPTKYFTNEVMEKIEEYVQQKFSYGSNTPIEPVEDPV